MLRGFSLRIGPAKFARFVMSLILAFAIWAFVTNERDPEQTQMYTNLDIAGADTLGMQFQLVDAFPAVDVEIKGPQSVVQGMSVANVRPAVDLSGITEAGTYEVDVLVDAPSGLRTVEVDPEVIIVEVGTVVSRLMDITILQPVNPPATLTSISLSTSQVRLVGVEQNVDSVDRVEVAVVLSGRTESFNFTAQPIPISGTGAIMSELIRVEPSSVQVSVEFEVRAKSVPIIVQCACPTETGGLEISDLLTAIAIPSTVRLEGPEALLADITSVRTIPINIEPLEVSGFLPDGAELDDSNLPEGVSLERQTIDVWVEIEQSIQSFTQRPVDVVNAGDTVQVSLSPETVTFEVQGPAESVQDFNGSPPLVIVDLDGLEPGTHVVPVRVVLPPDVRVVNIQPGEVQVTIEEIVPTPTPPPAPTPTPEPQAEPSVSSLLPMVVPLSGDAESDNTR